MQDPEALRVLDKRAMTEAARATTRTINVQIPDVTTMVRGLSGGQRQGVALARAVYFQAPVVLLDEPTAALGPRETAAVPGIVRRLRSEGKLVVMVTHNIPQILEMANHNLVMRSGRIVLEVDPHGAQRRSCWGSWSARGRGRTRDSPDRRRSGRRVAHRFPQIDGVMCAADFLAIGAAQAIRAAGKAGKIKIVTVDLQPDAETLLRDGLLTGAVVQTAQIMGRWGVRAAINALAGRQVPPELFTPIFIVTKSNVDKVDFTLERGPVGWKP